MQKQETNISSLVLPNTTKKRLLEFDPDMRVLKIVKDKTARLVFIVRSKGKEYFVKAAKKKSWRKSEQFYRFKKEIFIYSALQNMRFKNFNYPKLICTDNESFVIIESVPNKYDNIKTDAHYESSINGIYEFNSCEFAFKKKDRKEYDWRKYKFFKRSRSMRILPNLVRGILPGGKLSLAFFAKALFFYAKSYVGTAKLKRPLLLHRDLRFGVNRIYSSKDKVYFIDFEKAGIEKRWVFVDALVLAEATPLFYPDDNVLLGGFPRFYRKMIDGYWEKLLANDFGMKQEDYLTQLKVCLLSWSLRKIVKEKNIAGQQKEIKIFIKTVILGPKDNFHIWHKDLPYKYT